MTWDYGLRIGAGTTYGISRCRILQNAFGYDLQKYVSLFARTEKGPANASAIESHPGQNPGGGLPEDEPRSLACR